MGYAQPRLLEHPSCAALGNVECSGAKSGFLPMSVSASALLESDAYLRTLGPRGCIESHQLQGEVVHLPSGFDFGQLGYAGAGQNSGK